MALLKWTAVEHSEPDEEEPIVEYSQVGLVGFNFDKFDAD